MLSRAPSLRGRYQLNGFGSWTATRRDGPPGDCDSLIAQASRVQLLVLGRSIDPAGDELKRCERRAMAVLNALTKKGIAPERVELGHGVIKWPTVKPEPRVEARWRE
jgi:hypothetical protein